MLKKYFCQGRITPYQSLRHMALTGWDKLGYIMEGKAHDYPDLFELQRNGDSWHWVNKHSGMTIHLHSWTKPPCPTARWSTSPVKPPS